MQHDDFDNQLQDDFLHRIALGEVETTLQVENSPVAQERLAGLRRTIRALEEAGHARDLDLAEEAVENEEGIVEAFHAQLSASTTAPPVLTGPSRWRGFVAAAAVVLFFGLSGALAWKSLGLNSLERIDPTLPGASSHASPASLSGNAAGAEAPIGAVEQYGEFRWIAELAPGETFDLLVKDRNAPDARPLVVAEDLEEPRWTPDVQLPAALTWTVRVRGADGRLTGESFSADASQR